MTADEVKQRIEELRERRLNRGTSAPSYKLPLEAKGKTAAKSIASSDDESHGMQSTSSALSNQPDGLKAWLKPKDIAATADIKQFVESTVNPETSLHSQLLTGSKTKLAATPSSVNLKRVFTTSSSPDSAVSHSNQHSLPRKSVDSLDESDLDGIQSGITENSNKYSSMPVAALSEQKEVDIETSDDDKDLFFASIKETTGHDQSLDYAALNRELSDAEFEEDFDLTNALTEAITVPTSTILANALEESRDAIEPNNSNALEEQPVFVATADQSMLIDNYSMSFDSVSDLLEQKLEHQDNIVSKSEEKAANAVEHLEMVSDDATSHASESKNLVTDTAVVSHNAGSLEEQKLNPSDTLQPIQIEDSGAVNEDFNMGLKRAIQEQLETPQPHAEIQHPLNCIDASTGVIQLDHLPGTFSNEFKPLAEQGPYLTFADVLKMNNVQDETPAAPQEKAVRTKSPVASKAALLRRTNEKFSKPKPNVKPTLASGGKVATAGAKKKNDIVANTLKKASPAKVPKAPVKKAKIVVSEDEKQVVSDQDDEESCDTDTTTTSISVQRQTTKSKKPVNEKTELAQQQSPQPVVPQIDVAPLLAKIHLLEESLAKATSESKSKSEEIDTFKDQVLFLERILEEKQQTASKARLLAVNEPFISASVAETLRKEMNDQETLIQGYQNENEKLMVQIKMLRKEMREGEQRHFLKQEALVRENLHLKSQLGGSSTDLNEIGPDGQAKASDVTGFSSAKAKVRIEALETELAAVKHKSASKEADLKARIVQLDAQLSEASDELSNLRGADPERLRTLENEMKSKKKQYDAYIAELETKLEWFLERQELWDDNQVVIHNQEALIKDLRRTIEQLEQTPGENKLKRSTKASASDLRRVKELETEVRDLKAEKIRKQSIGSKYSLDSLVDAARPAISDGEYIKMLKQRIQKQEKDIENAIVASDEKIAALRQEANAVQKHYEGRIAELEISLNDLQTLHSADTKKPQVEEPSAGTSPGQTQRTFAEAMGKLTAESAQDREIALRRRIVELSRFIDEQGVRITELVTERQQTELEFAKKLEEKDALVASYQAKLVEIQQKIHDGLFSVEDQARLDEQHKLRMEVEGSRAELADLRNKLEISEGTRRAVHETTISILRQAQEESAKLALAHHERALNMLRAELRDETRAQTLVQSTAETSRFKQRIYELERLVSQYKQQLESQSGREWSLQKEQELTKLSAQVPQLQDMVKELQKENQSLSMTLSSAKRGWPPAMHQFDALQRRIQELEQRATQREQQISRIAEAGSMELHLTFEAEKRRLQECIRQKDEQLVHFRLEVDQLMHSIQDLKLNHKTMLMM